MSIRGTSSTEPGPVTERMSRKPRARADNGLDIADAPIGTPPRHRPGNSLGYIIRDTHLAFGRFRDGIAWFKVLTICGVLPMSACPSDRPPTRKSGTGTRFTRSQVSATSRFPDEFYKEIFRLRGWEWRACNRPQIVRTLHEGPWGSAGAWHIGCWRPSTQDPREASNTITEHPGGTWPVSWRSCDRHACRARLPENQHKSQTPAGRLRERK